ncbi:alpha/beta fold hydrolase [Dyadobacter sp. MSC1_007]|jgi:pimeloyl-ACP methyl ester carboxylesterase|uniref:alpha/beta fold hydrolase n=1 Tax=Dyadobacter sp. MSC1_007 TaxID=2909264 RepID=UPI00202F280E|nr:alpha/beta hydrolase [Dyadobacter sp. MSC1_007]
MEKVTVQMLLCLFLFNTPSISQERVVEISGRKYNVLTKGIENRSAKDAVVVFESGMGIDLGNWNKIIDQVSQFAPVFAYDRNGIGKSEKTYQLPTPENVAANLNTILKTLKILPPYILVGHSLGGVYARGFAGHYPNEVAGLVFIDPADFTETKEYWNDIFRKMGLPEKKIDEMLQNRLYGQKSKVDSLNFGPWSERYVLNELRKTDFAEISALPLPNVPIYFLVGGKFEVPVAQRSKDFDQETFFHIKNSSNMDRWKKLIHSSNKGGALIYLTNAGHYIHWDDPRSVVSNIRTLTEGLKE